MCLPLGGETRVAGGKDPGQQSGWRGKGGGKGTPTITAGWYVFRLRYITQPSPLYTTLEREKLSKSKQQPAIRATVLYLCAVVTSNFGADVVLTLAHLSEKRYKRQTGPHDLKPY